MTNSTQEPKTNILGIPQEEWEAMCMRAGEESAKEMQKVSQTMPEEHPDWDYDYSSIEEEIGNNRVQFSEEGMLWKETYIWQKMLWAFTRWNDRQMAIQKLKLVGERREAISLAKSQERATFLQSLISEIEELEGTYKNYGNGITSAKDYVLRDDILALLRKRLQ